MRGKKIEVLAVPVLSSHIEVMKMIAEQREMSVDQLASEIISKELKSQQKIDEVVGTSCDSEVNDEVKQPRAKEKERKPKKKDILLENIGIQIKRRRLDLGISQAELSKMTGYSRSLIVEMESGMRAMGLDSLYSIAAALGVEGSHIVHLAEQMSINALGDEYSKQENFTPENDVPMGQSANETE